MIVYQGKNVSREERGWAGHFICGARCRFRRNTLLTCGEVRVVVSTVGAMVVSDEEGFDTVGPDRHFETRAFMAKWDDPYFNADVLKSVPFTSPWSLFGVERDSDGKANDMHEAVVDEIAEMLASGWTYPQDESDKENDL